MPDLKNTCALSLEHQAQLSPLWKELCATHGLQFAEYSFANAFLFRRQHCYAYAEGDSPYLIGEFEAGKSYCIPTCLPKDCFSASMKKAFEGELTLFPIPESWLQSFAFDHPYIQSYTQDSDYLYHKEKLKTLSGRALSSRRNLLHQFEEQHLVEVRDLTEDLFADALQVLEEWQKHSSQPKEKTDYFSCCDALAYFQQLELVGRIVYADGLPVGFAIGELLTPRTALLHLSKSLHRYKGVTPFLYQDFAVHLPDEVEWINLEQDLGIPSLRAAKEAYEPDILLPKYRVSV